MTMGKSMKSLLQLAREARAIPEGYKAGKMTTRQKRCAHSWVLLRDKQQCMYCRVLIKKLASAVKAAKKRVKRDYLAYCRRCGEPFTKANPNALPDLVAWPYHEDCFMVATEDWTDWDRAVVWNNRTKEAAAAWQKEYEEGIELMREDIDNDVLFIMYDWAAAAKGYRSTMRRFAWNDRRNAKRRQKYQANKSNNH